MFRSSPPIDFAETDLGYVGSQNKFLLKIPNGQITVDAKRGQVFLIEGTQAVDLSAFGSGMNRFFTDHLAFEILRYFPDADIDNHFNGIGLHGVYDSKFERVIITKLDYIPLDSNIQYSKALDEYYIEEGDVITQVLLTDSEYFCNKSWTVSFNFNTKSWTSFHSYLPNFYIGENNFFYSGVNGCCEDFDFVAGPIVPDPTTTTTTRAIQCNFTGTAHVIYPTTTTTSTSTSTTTTTTTIPVTCFLYEISAYSDSPGCEGYVHFSYYDCEDVYQTGGSISVGVTEYICARDYPTITCGSGQVTYAGPCNSGASLTTTTTTVAPACMLYSFSNGNEQAMTIYYVDCLGETVPQYIAAGGGGSFCGLAGQTFTEEFSGISGGVSEIEPCP